ncbi:hypothetical protein [Paracoccus fontiphilus]|uniref:PEP-CTERM protein-sorting domain-containing protein n=1 Tax=Paracoccus fontiphilus TaxID=1815556 RepID=A0ABV7IFR9_9RHOB|nr:hypothetical protein [Paracoccus fontiphilus]
MIPAATVPHIPQTACTPDAPCWVSGLGFRPVEDTGTACAINDAPMGGKVTCASALGVLLIACEAEQASAWGMVDYPPAPVPVPPSLVLLIVAVGALFARPMWRAMGRLETSISEIRGVGPGKCGWP